MIYASFGIKLFYDRDLLLTENCDLVHYGKGTRGKFTIESPSNIYFYIYDEQLCREREDENLVTNVIELSKLPIYYGHNPKYSLCKEDHKRQELIYNSNVCLYFYEDETKLRLFLHYIYKDKVFERELNDKTLSLLKYTWFSSRELLLSDDESIGEFIFSYISELDINTVLNSLLIISGNKTFYGRDSESTQYGERLIINTKDPYILTN